MYIVSTKCSLSEFIILLEEQSRNVKYSTQWQPNHMLTNKYILSFKFLTRKNLIISGDRWIGVTKKQ